MIIRSALEPSEKLGFTIETVQDLRSHSTTRLLLKIVEEYSPLRDAIPKSVRYALKPTYIASIKDVASGSSYSVTDVASFKEGVAACKNGGRTTIFEMILYRDENLR